MYAQSRPFNWIDIGTIPDYWTVLQNVLAGELATLEVPGTQVRQGVWTGLNTSINWENTTIEGPVYIGSGVRIDPGVTIIGPTWIGHGSHICSGARIIRSILFEYTRVLSDVLLEEMIVCKEYCVNRCGEMRHVRDGSNNLWTNARDRRWKRRTFGDLLAS